MLHANEREIATKIAEQVHELTEAGIDAELELRATVVGRCANVIAGILLGSVTQRLLHVADCPVLVIPRGSARKVTAPARGRDLAVVTT